MKSRTAKKDRSENSAKECLNSVEESVFKGFYCRLISIHPPPLKFNVNNVYANEHIIIKSISIFMN